MSLGGSQSPVSSEQDKTAREVTQGIKGCSVQRQMWGLGPKASGKSVGKLTVGKKV